MNDACPPFSTIRRLGDSTDAEPDPGLSAHLESCRSCRDLLDRLAIEGTGSGPSTIFANGKDLEVEFDSLPSVPGLVDFQRIGRGGSAVVYKARREGLDVWVAVKFLDPGPPGSRSHRERAVREAQAAARVRHPNIIRTFDVGLAGGAPYIVMEYCERGTLADRLGKSGTPPREAARLVQTLAGAVQAIHVAGMVHRDLKPSNVMLHGPDDAPVLADFGLAREIDAEGLTDTRHGPGTPGYMAPEQVEGRLDDVGPAADVFGLGALLFRMLTGRPPFVGATRFEAMRMAVEEVAPPASRFAPDIPRRLEAIVARCLRRRPSERYPSAAALAEDLRFFLEDRRPAGRSLRIASRVGALLAVGAVAAALGDSSSKDPSARVTPLVALVSTPPPSPSTVGRMRDAQVKERVHAASRVVEGLTRTYRTMNAREIATIIEASEGALAEARAASPQLAGDGDFRRDYSWLAGSLGGLENYRGKVGVAVRLFAEAAEASRRVEGSTWTIDARFVHSEFLTATACSLMSMGRSDQARDMLEDVRDVLRPILGLEAAADRDRDVRALLASIQITEGPAADGWRAMAALREETRAMLCDRPRSLRLWRTLADVCRMEGRREEAVQAVRQLQLLPASEVEFGMETTNELARALIELARASSDRSRRRSALAEAEELVREGLARMERIEAGRGEEFAVMRDVGQLRGLASLLEVERERDGADLVGDRFADRLAAALAAETRGGRVPIDGNRLDSLRDELAAEYAWATRPGAFDPPGPDARRGYEPETAASDFERGLALLERGKAVEARLRFAAAFTDVAAGHRVREGDWRRAVELSEQARSLIDAMPDDGPLDARLAVLNETWSQTVKALWDHAERPRTRDALRRALDCARACFELRAGELFSQRSYDKAIARLANFEREGGDYDTAATIMAMRRPLCRPGTHDAVILEDALRAIEDERKARPARGLATALGSSPAASP